MTGIHVSNTRTVRLQKVLKPVPSVPATTVSRGNLTKPFGMQTRSWWRRRLVDWIFKDKETKNLVSGYVFDIWRLDWSFGLLAWGHKGVIVNDDDQFLARRLVGIASTYGFRCEASAVSWSMTFQIQYPEYQQSLRVWADPWPKGLIMFLDEMEELGGGSAYEDMLARQQTADKPVFKREQIVPEFVRLLELSLKMRADYLRTTKRAET